MDFWKELCLSAIKGLASLISARPKLACTILSIFMICYLVMLPGLLAYHWGYRDCQTHISNEFAQHLSGLHLSKRQRKQLDSRVNKILRQYSSKIDSTIEKHISYFYIAGAILIILILFCLCVELAKQNQD